MTRPLLYTFRRCPYAIRARMALLQAGAPFEPHEVSLRDKPAEMLARSPKGTVPVLVLPDGRVIDESLDIMKWAFEGRDVHGWWQRGQTADCLALIALCDGAFKLALDRYKYPQRHAGGEGRTVDRDQAVSCLVVPLERQLTSQPYLGGAQPCAADLAIFPFVRQFRAVDDKWFDAQRFDATRQWLAGWTESELFARCMARLNDGPAGDPPTPVR